MSVERALIDTNVLVYSTDEAWTAAETFAQAFEVLSPPGDLFTRVATLGRTLGMKAQDVFDLAIGITAVEAGVGVVYSYDSSVFSRVPGLVVREPATRAP